MRTIQLTQRQCRLLRDNLTSQESGYDHLDLRRLDALAQKLTTLQGDYAVRMAELARDEKRLRRQFDRKQITEEAANQSLRNIAYEVEDLHEAAEVVQVELVVEDGDHRLILDKLDAVQRWLATDELRPVILGMLDAVRNAPGEDAGETVKPFKKREHTA